MQKNKLNKLLILLLVIIAIITHIEWFNFGNILFFSDWTHWNNYSVSDLTNFGFGTWFNHFGFGNQNIQLYFNFFEYIWGIIGDYEIGTKITFYIPIALLSFLSPYFLIKCYTKNNFVAFLIALFFGLNTHLLVKETAHLPLAFIISFSPIILIYFDKFLKNLNSKNTIIFSLLYFVGICYEIRVMYIITFILLFYLLFLYFSLLKNKNFYKQVGLFIIIQLLLNSFWFLPIIFGGGSQAIGEVANRGLFGNFLFNIQYAFNVFDNSWTGGFPNQDFIPQKIPFYLWFYPFLVVFSFLFINKLKGFDKKLYLFGIIISLIGILLTKQSGEPFPNLYLWLYNNFPGFNLFREAGKFYIITLIGYSIVLGLFFNILYKNYKKYLYFIGILIIFISFLIAKPLITKEIGTIFVPKIEPKEYIILNQYIKKENSNFKTLWIPRVSQWGVYDIKNPKISLVNILDKNYGFLITSDTKKRNYKDFSSFIFEPLENSTNILDISGIKYVIIGLKDNQDDFFRFYGSTPEDYYKKLKEIKGLEELNIEGIKEIKIFENKSYLEPVFYSNKLISSKNIDSNNYKNLKVEIINPALYKINLDNIQDNGYINLSQKQNSSWKLIVGDFKWYDILFKNINYLDGTKGELSFINSWKVEEIKNKKVSLYFIPQSYFILGIIISVTTFVLLILGLIIYTIRNRKNVIINNIEQGNKQ